MDSARLDTATSTNETEQQVKMEEKRWPGSPIYS